MPRADVLHLQGLAQDRADAHAGVERGVWVLEHDLEVAPATAQVPAPKVRHVGAVEADRSRGGLFQGDDEATDGRLATARLADEAEGLALSHGEGDIGDCLDAADLALQHGPGGDGELLYELVDLDDDLAGSELLDSLQCQPGGLGRVDDSDGVARGIGASDRVEAGHQVAAVFDERRFLDPAPLDGVSAAGLEPAPDEFAGKVRRRAWDRVERDTRIRVHLRDRVEQRLGVGVAHL